MASDRGSRLSFWVGPGVVLAVIVVVALIAVVTNRPELILRVSLPGVYLFVAWIVVLNVWSRLEERRLLVARARFPDDVVESALRSKRSITALWMLRPLGYEVLERAPRRWMLVVTTDAVEIWGGPLRRLERYARLPFARIVDVEIDRMHDRREFHHGLVIRVATAGEPWPVPLLLLGGSPFGLGSAGPEFLSGVRAAMLVHSSRETQ